MPENGFEGEAASESMRATLPCLAIIASAGSSKWFLAHSNYVTVSLHCHTAKGGGTVLVAVRQETSHLSVSPVVVEKNALAFAGSEMQGTSASNT